MALQTRLRARAAGVREAGWTPEAAGGPRVSLLLDCAPAPPTPANLRRFLGALLKQLQARLQGSRAFKYLGNSAWGLTVSQGASRCSRRCFAPSAEAAAGACPGARARVQTGCESTSSCNS